MALEKKRTSIKDLEIQIAKLSERLDVIENKGKITVASIHKIEDYAGEKEPTFRDADKMKMTHRNMIDSAVNACLVLPPNLIVDGRHTTGNVSALCGFKVDGDLLDEVYAKMG